MRDLPLIPRDFVLAAMLTLSQWLASWRGTEGQETGFPFFQGIEGLERPALLLRRCVVLICVLESHSPRAVSLEIDGSAEASFSRPTESVFVSRKTKYVQRDGGPLNNSG
jgi:hypothetical protein